jgi:glycerol-3-phosphate dehydrogenase
MKRNVEQLANKEYDLVIIGGGIFGACAAWDAVLRGLNVALVEKDDFCQATSANHFKMIHGGMRYLQHLDLKRARESSQERTILLRTAPHLTKPLPIMMPTYGHGMKGKEVLGAGLFLYELLTFDRNKDIHDPARQIPRSFFIGKEEILKEYTGLDTKNLTGGVVFYDGQIYNPPRLVLSYIRAAVQEGLDTANYMEVTDYVRNNSRIKGVVVLDRITGDRLEIRSRFVLNAAGPWAHRLNEQLLKKKMTKIPYFSRDLIMVIPKMLSRKYAFAHLSKSHDKDAVLDRGGRHLFIVPWRNYSLIGVWHQLFNKVPEEISIDRLELQQFLDEINHVFKNMQLTFKDISIINTGLILFGTEKDQGGNFDHSFGKRSMIVDHLEEDGFDGLVTLIGVRATVARLDAVKTIDLILKKLNIRPRESKTSTAPIYGGQIENFEEYVQKAKNHTKINHGTSISKAMVHNYGSRFQSVLNYIREDSSLNQEIDSTSVIRAEIIHAVREEMAVKLQDVVFRRTDLGTGENPGRRCLEVSAELMAKEHGWSKQKVVDEINEVMNIFAKKGPWRIG